VRHHSPDYGTIAMGCERSSTSSTHQGLAEQRDELSSLEPIEVHPMCPEQG
jgi:hypothetical protein